MNDLGTAWSGLTVEEVDSGPAAIVCQSINCSLGLNFTRQFGKRQLYLCFTEC